MKRRSIIFVGLVAMAFGIIALVTLVGPFTRNYFSHLNPIILTACGVFLTLFLYNPAQKALLHWTQKSSARKELDDQKLLNNASKGIARIKSLHHLLNLITHFVTMRVRVKRAAVLVFDKEHKWYQSCVPRGYPHDHRLQGGVTLNDQDPLIQFLAQEKTSIDLEGVKKFTATKKKEFRGTHDFNAIQLRMEELLATCCVPSFLGDDLRNVLVLGEKKSEDGYNDQDLELFHKLAQEVAIAVENAKSFDEAIYRSTELEIKSNQLESKSHELFLKTVELEEQTSALERKRSEVEAVNVQLESTQTELINILGEMDRTHKRLKHMQVELMETKKRALLAGISSAVGHEIRNPMTPMVGRMYFLRKKVKEAQKFYDESLAAKLSKEESKRYRAMIESFHENISGLERSGDRIRGIVNTLVNLVKERSEHKSEVQVSLVVEGAIEEIRFQTHWESLTASDITKDIPINLPFVCGMTQDLQGVFVNLIMNSLHAMEQNSNRHIQIKANVDPDDASKVLIRFADNGSGIPNEEQKKVFEHGFTTKGQQGAGLGLFYCKDNIERVHGGSISVKSEKGVGTVFLIGLPIYVPHR